MTTSQFIWSLSLNILGSLIGVAVGVWVSNCQMARQRVAEKRELRRRLIQAFQSNVAGIEQMFRQLTEKSEVPDYRLDTDSIAHILFHGRELFDDERWFERFNRQRYQLVHINAKVDFLNDITNLSGISSGSIFSQGGVGQQRISTLVGHLNITKKDISDLIEAYEKVA